MKKVFIIVNSILSFFTIYCFLNFVIGYIRLFVYYVMQNNTTLYQIVFHSDTSLHLLVSMLILQVLVNIFILLLAKTKEK